MEILDLQAPPSDALYLVSLDPISPYPQIVEPNRGVWIAAGIGGGGGRNGAETQIAEHKCPLKV